MLIPIILLSFTQLIHSKDLISLYADVFKDREFFTRTFPWIIDNIGGEIQIDYYLLGSGKYSVPQMCTLEQLRDNPFLQAQYLKCEAEDKPSAYCLCESGLDPEEYKECVRHRANFASESAHRFSILNLDVTPIIELSPRSTVFQVSDTWYLKKICTIFGDYPPLGCVKPFACNGTEEFRTRNGLAQFDRECVLPEIHAVTTTTTQPSYTRR
ncbi:uncharacterized protein LOC114357928 isoform X1 [Ostrinia furnacalis]|uniref:uncharacterized protein LOC114357928 isoform X1 n=1 Tax=Ostrinia furnacalis TaxID=93504 RepID=UPI00103F4EB2|nr:uncharacterized protein LOC114357928 isoform X1 [Ostrinia furnacalis]